jgi:hypothetical protein
MFGWCKDRHNQEPCNETLGYNTRTDGVICCHQAPFVAAAIAANLFHSPLPILPFYVSTTIYLFRESNRALLAASSALFAIEASHPDPIRYLDWADVHFTVNIEPSFF